MTGSGQISLGLPINQGNREHSIIPELADAFVGLDA
jgi:hypothetical protein